MYRLPAACLLILTLLLAGCASTGTAAPTDIPLPTLPATATPPVFAVTPGPCQPGPVTAPTLPAEIPGYAQLDPASGLHITGRAQAVDLQTYRLRISGKVDHPGEFSYDQLRCMPQIRARVTLVCPGYFEDNAEWAGVSLRYLLEQAGVQPGAASVELAGLDLYNASLPLEEALADHNFLAYELEGQPLPALHGFPIRAVFPAQEGNKWVKWLVEIRVK